MKNKEKKFSIAELINKNKKLSLAVIVAILVILIVVTVALVFGGKSSKAASNIPYSKISEAEIALRSDSFSMIVDGGYSKDVPKNTIEAFERAHGENYYDVFFEVQLTKDGMWVVFDEDELNGTTDMKGKVSDYTYYELLEGSLDFDYVSKYTKKYKIPTLEDILNLCASHDLKPYISVDSTDTRKLEDIVILLGKYGILEKSAIVSTNTKTLLEIQTFPETVECWYSMDKITSENIGIIKANPTVGALYNMENSSNRESQIKDLCKAGAKVGCYNINTLEDFEDAYTYGVTTFITQRILLK